MTSTTKTDTPDIPNTHAEGMREFDREMLRSDFLGVFWAAIQKRKKDDKFTMQMLADALGRDKTTISRWFDGSPKNWETDTIADIAAALDLELIVRARDRKSGTVFSPSGIEIELVERGGSCVPRTTTMDTRSSRDSVVQVAYA